ncbi:MAG: hypothetical protein KF829_04925 [Ferruginibacter sp.]|nr:hypothetical protein [Ferruginibacter sp.]
MQKGFLFYFISSLIFVSFGCHKKTVPSKTSIKKSEVISPLPPPKPIVPRPPTPKFIIVNDAVAKKAVDGRLYYDLEGKRYWKNKKDGKYYLYNKSMHGNPDFTPATQ